MTVLRDPSTSKGANVNEDGQLEIHASNAEQIHWYSEVKEQAYSVIGTTDTLTAAKVPVIYIKNTSTTLDLVIERLMLQTVAEAATIPAVGIFWTIDIAAAVSGGTAVIPTNYKSPSGNLSNTTALHSTPTIDTAGTQLLKLYPKADGEIIEIFTEGALILGPNGTCVVSYTTTGTAGIAHANISFYMEALGAG